MNVWKTRHYTSDHGGQPTANSKSLVQQQRRTDDQVSWVGNVAQEVGDDWQSVHIWSVLTDGSWFWCALCFLWVFISPPCQNGQQRQISSYPFILLSIRASVNEFLDTIFWKYIYKFWCKLAQAFHAARAQNDQLLVSEAQSQGHTAQNIGHKNPFHRGISKTIQQI